MIGFLKKPWWVGPLALIAGIAVGHPGKTKPAGPVGVRGSEIVNSRGTLPRNGSVVVIATCPAGKRVIGGGYVAPSVGLSLIHISEPTRLGMISYAVFCLKK